MTTATNIPDRKKFNILLVEDEQDARDIYTDIIISNGFNLDLAINGNDAELKISQKKYDMILLDVVMPEKNGLEVLQEISNNPQIYGTPKVIILSNIAGEGLIEQAGNMKVDGYLLKSQISPTDLVDFILQKLQ